jgi:hypothetical protein
MKKILGIVLLGLFWCGASVALDQDTCSDYSAKAKTDMGARIMFSVCEEEYNTSFYNRSDKFKCALKAAKASSEIGARQKYSTCVDG